MRNRRLVIPILLLGAAIGRGAEEEGPFPIKFNRPAKPGDVVDVSVALDNQLSTTITRLGVEGAAARKVEKHLQVQLNCRCEVVEVMVNGDPARYKLSIEKCLVGERQLPVLERGDQVDVNLTYKEVTFLRGDAPLPAEAAEALAGVFSPLNSTGATLDDMFGSKLPRKVGESWEVNSESIARRVSNKAVIDPKNVSGRVTLRGTQVNAGKPSIDIQVKYKATDARPVNFTPQHKLISSTSEVEMTAILPVEETLPRLELMNTVDSRSVYEIQSATPERVETQQHVATHAISTPVGK